MSSTYKETDQTLFSNAFSVKNKSMCSKEETFCLRVFRNDSYKELESFYKFFKLGFRIPRIKAFGSFVSGNLKRNFAFFSILFKSCNLLMVNSVVL